MKPTPQLHVLLSFAHGTDDQVETTTEAVLKNLYGNSAFATPAPPVTQADLQAALVLFREKKAAMAQGGTSATAAKDEQRAVLVALLRKLATYVQEQSANVLSVLPSSGFHAASTNRAPYPLATPAIRSVRIPGPGQRLVDLEVVDAARCYEIGIALLDSGGAPGPYVSAGLFTRARGIRLDALQRGASYLIQARAVGGATGYSEWSDPVASMSL